MNTQKHREKTRPDDKQAREEKSDEARRKEEAALDEALKDSFPASDPLPSRSSGHAGGVRRDRK